MTATPHTEPVNRIELTDDERTGLIWALEVGRAILLSDPLLVILARETSVRPALLDALADRLFIAGCPAAREPSADPPTPIDAPVAAP